jgi:hypothetical protein
MASRGGGNRMKRNRLFELAAVPVIALGFFPLLFGQTPDQAGTAKVPEEIPARNLEGVWSAGKAMRASTPVTMTPEGQTLFESNTVEARDGKPLTRDPAFQCLPPGVPRIYSYGQWAIEFVQTPKRIFLFYENVHTFRTIYMDGRKMPSDVDVDPSWLGYSIGHWEGNDLVVETGLFNDKTWADSNGHPHSDAMRLTERFHRVDIRTLNVEVIVDDPKYYTKPWTLNAVYKLQPKWELQETFCIPEQQMKFTRDEGIN